MGGTLGAGGEEARLASLAETELLDTPAEEGFDRITRLAQKLFGVSTSTVALIADDRQFLKSLAGSLQQNAARADSFCTHTIRTPDMLVVEDARTDERFKANSLVLGDPNIRFYAGQPLQGLGGYNIGTLCLIDQPLTGQGDPKMDYAGFPHNILSTPSQNDYFVQCYGAPILAPS